MINTQVIFIFIISFTIMQITFFLYLERKLSMMLGFIAALLNVILCLYNINTDKNTPLNMVALAASLLTVTIVLIFSKKIK